MLPAVELCSAVIDAELLASPAKAKLGVRVVARAIAVSSARARFAMPRGRQVVLLARAPSIQGAGWQAFRLDRGLLEVTVTGIAKDFHLHSPAACEHLRKRRSQPLPKICGHIIKGVFFMRQVGAACMGERDSFAHADYARCGP